MRHLAKEQLLDLAEGTPSESAVAHMKSCEVCRTGVEDLRAVMAAAADVEVPEPSPLFWEHFSDRVREAVAAEGTPVSHAWMRWANWRVIAPVAVSIAVVAAAVITLGPTSPPMENSTRNNVPPVGNLEPVAMDVAPLSEDPSLSVLADLTSDLDWDTATQAGLMLKPGAVDDLVTTLNDDERQELRRLLQEELGRPGA